MKTFARPLALVLAAALWLVSADAAAQSRRDALLEQAHEDISNWQIPAAAEALAKIEAEGIGVDAEVLYARGRLAFFSGEYKQAAALVDQAITAAPNDEARRTFEGLRGLIKDTQDVVKDYKEFRSPNGYFIIRVEPGKDEILIPYAYETLEAAYEQFAKDFGYKPPAPVRVEIYPTAATLAKVSPLTEAEIKNSGTIALCKYNRLMFTSPKALLKGYGWRDTLAHEFAHLVITQRSNNTVPIWMHEGLAKFQERRWRGQDPALRLMPPSSENLLAKGVKDKKLITFEQMHPSMAKLPDQDSTALAFAEVYTVMEYILAQKGEGVFGEMLTLMRQNKDAEKTIEALLGVPFAAFQRNWMAYLKTRPAKSFDEEAVYVEKLRFIDDKPGSELLDIGKKEARDLIHLGELLQARKRYAAAAIEYQKARELIGDRNPILQTRLAKSLIEIKKYQEAADALTRSLAYYPSHHNTYVLLGEALYRLGRKEEAEVHFVEAIGINPYDPKPHRFLSQIYADTGRDDLAARARANAEASGG